MKTSGKIIVGLLGIALIVVIIAIVVVISGGSKSKENTVPLDEKNIAQSPVTGFSWRYGEGEEGPDGLPQTKVFLDVIYANGSIGSHMIDEVQGSCNDVDPASEDTDKLSGTAKIQCYAAGFGQWYKIVKGNDSYEIRRKYFEEAHPDSVPPEYNYETIKEFPL